MPRKGENIYKRKDGRWEGRYIRGKSNTGKAVYGYVYAKTYRDVKHKLLMAVRGAKEDNGAREYTESVSFCELADEWLLSVKTQVKISTFNKYKNLIHSYILPQYQTAELAQITPDSLHAFCAQLLNCGGKQKNGLSSKTVADTLTLIRSILRYAEKKGFHPRCSGREISVKQSPSPMRILSKEEQRILCRYLFSDLNERNLGILVCLFTGLRIGELCALRWEDVSLRDRTIHVHSTMQRIQIEGNERQKTMVMVTTPKSACSIRTIPVPDELMEILIQTDPRTGGYFLTGSDQNYTEPRIMQNYFKCVLKQCALPPVNFHVLRHTFATRCVELGFDVKSLSEILGHANINITMNRYVHPTMELKRQNMQRLSLLFTVK